MEKATRMTEPMGMMEAMAVEILTEVTSTVEKVVLMSEGCFLPTRGGGRSCWRSWWCGWQSAASADPT